MVTSTSIRDQAAHQPARFRAHQTAPSFESQLLAGLAQDWVLVNADPASTKTVIAWTQDTDADTHLNCSATSPGELIDLVDRADRRAVDAIVRPLLVRANRGENLAQRVLLQLMLPCLTNLARRLRPLEVGEDKMQRVLAAFWETLARPLPTSATGLVGRLQLDTLHRTTASQRTRDVWDRRPQAAEPEGPGSEAAPPAPTLVYVNEVELQDPATCTGPDSSGPAQSRAAYDSNGDLLDLVLTARADGVLSGREAQFLVDVYVAAPAGESQLSQAARRLGLSPDVVRQRCQRLRTRLIAAVVHSADIDAIDDAA